MQTMPYIQTDMQTIINPKQRTNNGGIEEAERPIASL